MIKKHDPRPAASQAGLTRRQALAALAAAAAGSGLLASSARGQSRQDELDYPPDFRFAQLSYGSGQGWNPYPTAARAMMETLADRTSIVASPDRVDLPLDAPDLFLYPFIYWTGTEAFEPLPEDQIDRLRFYLEMGGFLLADDALGASGIGFDKAFQRELSRLFPGRGLERLPGEHVVYQSFYLLDRPAGRLQNQTYLSGLDRDGRTAIIYSTNDLGGAWAKNSSGGWLNRCEPGGERQRELAFRLGVNLVMYALCGDYKKDLVHVPFIDERRRGKRRP